MRILVFSDSHGNTSRMFSVVRANIDKTDLIVHLGDVVGDAAALSGAFPNIAFLNVAGNNDRYTKTVLKHTFTVEGVKIFLTHGHMYDVHLSLLGVYYAAKQQGVSIALFGHTHVPCNQMKDGVLLFNPGSISSPRGNNRPSYGVVEIENGEIRSEIIYPEE